MSEIDELKAKIENLEQRVTFLEETIQTLADINKSNQVGKHIINRQRAMAVANLVNSAATRSELNMQAQKNILQALEEEKAAADKRIKAAIQEAVASAGENTLAKDFSWRGIDGGVDRTVEIRGYDGFDVKTLIIPETIRDKTVIKIGEDAFRNLELTEVVIPDSVRCIKSGAFETCKKLEKVRFSRNLNELGGLVFNGCKNLKNLDLPNSLRSIGGGCFSETGVEYMVMPKNLEVIPNDCFSECRKLKKVILNENLKKIEERAFSGTALKEIIIPESVEKVNISAFSNTELHWMRLAFLGMTTKFIDSRYELSKFEGTIYCLPGSEIQKQARLNDLEARPLSEFEIQ